MSIPELIKGLDDKARVDKVGKMGSEVVIDKELIRQASTYLKDYLYLMGVDEE